MAAALRNVQDQRRAKEAAARNERKLTQAAPKSGEFGRLYTTRTHADEIQLALQRRYLLASRSLVEMHIRRLQGQRAQVSRRVLILLNHPVTLCRGPSLANAHE